MTYARRVQRFLVFLGLVLVAAALIPAWVGWSALAGGLALVVPLGGLLQSWRAGRALVRAQDAEAPGARIWRAEVEAIHDRGVELTAGEVALFVPARTARWAVAAPEDPPPLVPGLAVQVYGWVERRAEGRLLLQRTWLAPDDGELADRMRLLSLRPWVWAAAIELAALLLLR